MSIESQEISKNYNTHAYADFFEATVVSCDPGTEVIIVAPDGERNHAQLQGIPLASTFAASLGFTETILPSIGTRVLCQGRNNQRTIIIGSIPVTDAHGNGATAVLPNKAILGTKEPIFEAVHKNGYLTQVTKAAIFNNGRPTDVLPGEKVISNEFGVMMGLFKLLATLKASELSQIQCHFLDDLVRIISHNFQHYTALGELKVFHDGQGIHMEVGATHKPSESLGQNNDPSITKINDQDGYDQFYKLADNQQVMLERMKLFMGQLGQFVNLLIINPSQEAHALNGKPLTTPDTGLLQIKASLDGTLIVRSVNGIYLEKTNWIRVPQRLKTPEDPTGDDGTTLVYPPQPAYVFDSKYQYREVAFLYYLQLRDYLAYINEELGYTNFKAHTKDFHVNDDKDKESPLDKVTYVDQETGIAYTQTKSWVSLMGNGGISLSDAWGSAINMEGGNIYIQPAKDLIVQPNRNLIAKVGGNVGIAAKGELDLSSTNGGLRVKTNTAQYLYSSTGGIVLHSDGQPYSNDIIGYGNVDGAMVTNVSGIVFNAPNSSVNSYGLQVYSNAKDTFVVDALQTTIHSTDITRIMSEQEVVTSANAIITSSETETISYSVGENIMLGMTGTLIGKRGQDFGVVNFMGGYIPVEGIPDENNVLDKPFFANLASIASDLEKFKLSSVIVSFKDVATFGKLKFQFPPTKLYGLDQNVDIIPQTVSQQTDDLSAIYNLKNWVETSVNSSFPYPGSDFSMSLATVKVNNIDVDISNNISIANKAVGLLSKSTVVISNIFTNYKSM